MARGTPQKERPIRERQELLKKLKKHDISHKNLGTDYGFQEAEQWKQRACNYVDKILSLTLEEYKSLNPVIVEQALGILRQPSAANKLRILYIAEKRP